ncbi:MAG: hypothetical protein AAGG07_04515 [Planctomycetota bacterium]
MNATLENRIGWLRVTGAESSAELAQRLEAEMEQSSVLVVDARRCFDAGSALVARLCDLERRARARGRVTRFLLSDQLRAWVETLRVPLPAR